MKPLTSEQLEWCEKHLPEGKWKINNEGLVDVEGSVNFVNQNFQRLPVSFGRVSGGFDLEGCKNLLTLEGGPREVGGYFDCRGCISLKTLDGAPQKVGLSFDCRRCTGLQTLEGAPQNVDSWFSCEECTDLRNLKGAPQHVGGFWCDGCVSLPEWVHSLANDFNEKKISWEEFLQTYDKFLQKPKLGQAKNLGLF